MLKDQFTGNYTSMQNVNLLIREKIDLGSIFNEVFINPDLTYREKASLKLLLDERKRLNKEEENKNSTFRFVIRNDLLERIEIKKH